MRRPRRETIWLTAAYLLLVVGWGSMLRGIADLTGRSIAVHLLGWGVAAIVGGLVLLFLLASEARD